jgi:hypothetical protein
MARVVDFVERRTMGMRDVQCESSERDERKQCARKRGD